MAQTIYHYDNGRIDFLFFDKNLSQFVPHLVQMHDRGNVLHNRLWNDPSGLYHPERTTMYLTDWQDDGNAGVNTLPVNSIMIGLSPLSKDFYIAPSVERFQHLFSHELTHVVMTDKYTKEDLRWRRFLGAKVAVDSRYPLSSLWSYLSIPRWYSPRWYHEGIACFLETWMNGGVGRALGGYDEMYFRSIVASDEPIFSVVGLETEGTTTDFQMGTNSYLYGTRFVNYLAYRYGVDSLFTFYNRTQGSSRFFARQFKSVYGTDLRKEWNNWRAFERNFQADNIGVIQHYPITKCTPVVSEALGSVSPLVYDSKRHVAYASTNHPGDFARVVSIDLESGKVKTLAKIDGPRLYLPAYVAFDPKGDRLFVTTHNGDIRGLRVYDAASGGLLKSIPYTRVGSIVYDPVRERLYGIQNNNGVSSIVYYNKDLSKPVKLYAFPFGQSVADLTVSHSGDYLVLSVSGLKGEQLLVRFTVDDLENARFEYTTLKLEEETNLSQFRFSLDDASLYGCSYYTGVSNIWRLDVATGETALLSNVETGLFAPLQIAEDTLLALHFTRNGMIPVTMGIREIHDAEAITFLGQMAFERNPALEHLGDASGEPSRTYASVYDEIEVYNSFTELRFSGAYPDLTGYKETVAAGYRVLFQDRLGLNRLNLYVGFSPWSNLPWSERFHFNLNWSFWGWTLDAYYNNSSFYDLFGPLKVSRRGYKVGLGYHRANVLLKPFRYEWEVKAATYGGMDALPLFQNIASPVSSMTTLSGRVEISKLRTSLGGVKPEGGYRFALSGGTYLAEREFFPQLYVEYDRGFLLPVMRNTALWLRASAGQSFGDPNSAFGNDYFGGFRNNYVDYRESDRYRELNAMPGTEIDAISAHSFAKLTAELNLCPYRFKDVGILGLYPTYTQLSFFSTGLLTDAWGEAANLRNYVNVGVQLNLEVVIFSYLKTTWSAGYAYMVHESETRRVGIPGGQWMFSLKLL